MRAPIAFKSWLTFLGYAALAVGFGLILACSFQEGVPRKQLAGAGLAAVAVGGAALLLLQGRQLRGSVKSWTGPAAVAFIIGGPILMVVLVMILGG
jgi:hypothetical protein